MASIGKVGSEVKGAVRPLGLKAAAQQGRALAHADQAVPTAGPPRAAVEHGVGDRESERLFAERQLDLRSTRAVARRVGERFLQDSVGARSTAAPSCRGDPAVATVTSSPPAEWCATSVCSDASPG